MATPLEHSQSIRAVVNKKGSSFSMCIEFIMLAKIYVTNNTQDFGAIFYQSFNQRQYHHHFHSVKIVADSAKLVCKGLSIYTIQAKKVRKK